jgi:hypothetical protein
MTMPFEIHDYGNDRGLSREALAAKHLSEVYDSAELQALFTVHALLAPYVRVTRKADGRDGTLEFQHSPRYYYRFVPA